MINRTRANLDSFIPMRYFNIDGIHLLQVHTNTSCIMSYS
jgi:hypothetical protein